MKTGRFAWGISTSSYQYEDPAVKKGDPNYFQTDWDLFEQRGHIPPKGNALYSWSHFDKDLIALKRIGATHYRLSVSWARVEPQPGYFNESAIQGYVQMAKKLKAAGIEPIVCLWHFTFPNWLYDPHHRARSNWLHPQIDFYWQGFVNKMVTALAPHVRYFAPQNEPNGQLATAYLGATWPPGMFLRESLYDRSMKKSVHLFRQAALEIKTIRPDAVVISIHALPWWKRGPLDFTKAFYNAMQRVNFEHLDQVADVCDVIGINYYYSSQASLFSYVTTASHHGPHYSMMGWKIDPLGLYHQIQTVKERYGKPMMITENGIATLHDDKRIHYMSDHLSAMQRARGEGADVRGYFVWSLADNYEWHYGYSATFGLSKMDPKSLDRLLKPSAFYYRRVIQKERALGRELKN